ncbi:hypothetical protein PaecuDRAFT_3938 [Paenibacillus curdlanolyticus YK9]|uniref:Uncharacterized protein n=1 Tax=Paenibacillus curdlanolyticus YK9 TaxID=717606 RepID=E0IE47_9BACL|nr:hypothetical protein [Paenibacillus curdlanolyticus]EFM09401.1 hypothetical protein PaecuDRAFT_3938 [Paenibacillus curdlanolyticus YK9]
MKKSKRIILNVISTLVISVTLLSGISFAQNNEEQPKVLKVHEYNGKLYRSLAGAGEVSVNAKKPDIDYNQASLEEAKVNDRMKFKEWLLENHKDKFGGVYTDDNGEFVFAITGDSLDYENYIKKASIYATNFKFKKVKYSNDELEAAQEAVQKFNVATSINPKSNKLEIFIDEESLKKHKTDILLAVKDAEMVEFLGGSITEELQAATLFPGEKIDFQEASGWTWCSLGFNATKGSSSVGVTAGHCGNNTYYDLSDNSSSIGTMTDANNSGYYDAGSITYNSNAIRSHVLNGSTLTIGTYDYTGTYREVGDYVKLHVTSGNGASYGNYKVIMFLNEPGTVQDRVIIEKPPAIGGDSGGLVYTTASAHGTNYARIEGIHRGLITINGTEYGQFIKFSRVYDGLGLSGVFVDSSY